AQPTFLFASPDSDLLIAIEPTLRAAGARVDIVLSAQAALNSISGPRPPSLVLLDAQLPGMPMGQLLAAVRAEAESARLPIVLIADTVTQEWIDRFAEGAVDDLVLRSAESTYWQLRLDLVLRNQRMAHELETLQNVTLRNAQLDRLTGVYNRETLLAMLFRETDRVQRSQSEMCLVLFDIDDFGHWNFRLGVDACDELLCQVASRTAAQLRSYDVLGRPGMDEFLIALPLCAPLNAMSLAERLRAAVFSTPFHASGEAIRLSACFGIAVSHGRSPVVVLREAEKALEWAKAAGPESIQCFGNAPRPLPSPITFLSATSGDELLAW
ncbi:MAG TPA: GGDEF domain-containing response regulator, partial [Terracidiphilus sp.]|nr:GGDEF domain-containing response regulator [Terracidiphilus sp.]